MESLKRVRSIGRPEGNVLVADMAYSVRLTANFESNLEAVRAFLTDAEAAHEFDRLLGYLFNEIIPNLERFPLLGRDFLAREPQSIEAQAKLQRVETVLRRGTELREYIAGDYLILYALTQDSVFLLSIKHHRQLSFDLRAFW